jgi:hypothetical protein
MCMALEQRCLTESVAMPLAHLLSTWMVVRDYGCPRYSNVKLKLQASCAMLSRAASSALAAEDMTSLRVILVMWTAPLMGSGVEIWCRLLR